ncbi:hypothetical protein B0H16DRAFT_1457535 [Mycena metata]|uniref:Uncharacterized protein n=1 Tax=Mycena metata TaxID=1033252 RepID=A0AAD7J7R5_9AGAR|nr:hypothetical protein B0H16DRAFT_1457535 [Mycena metata]
MVTQRLNSTRRMRVEQRGRLKLPEDKPEEQQNFQAESRIELQRQRTSSRIACEPKRAAGLDGKRAWGEDGGRKNFRKPGKKIQKEVKTNFGRALGRARKCSKPRRGVNQNIRGRSLHGKCARRAARIHRTQPNIPRNLQIGDTVFARHMAHVVKEETQWIYIGWLRGDAAMRHPSDSIFSLPDGYLNAHEFRARNLPKSAYGVRLGTGTFTRTHDGHEAGQSTVVVVLSSCSLAFSGVLCECGRASRRRAIMLQRAVTKEFTLQAASFLASGRRACRGLGALPALRYSVPVPREHPAWMGATLQFARRDDEQWICA